MLNEVIVHTQRNGGVPEGVTVKHAEAAQAERQGSREGGKALAVRDGSTAGWPRSYLSRGLVRQKQQKQQLR